MTTPIAAPSIKGRILAGAIEDIQKLIAGGKLKRQEVDRWLSRPDIELLEQPISNADWYDIQIYTRVCALLRDVDGEGSNAYLEARGHRTGERLLAAGLYAQLEYVNRMKLGTLHDPIERHQTFGRDLKLLVTISSSIMNFSRWSSRTDVDYELRYQIDVTDAGAFPDVLGWTSLGFVNCMAAAGGVGNRVWRWERIDAENLSFRMNRAL